MSFEEKKNLLFSSLESAEQDIGTDSILHQNVKNTDYSLDRTGKTRTKLISVDRYRGRESIFKRPNAPIGRCLKRTQLPDYKRNPDKWTKYTLEDADTSDRTNMAAAFCFLRQMEEQREEAPQIEEDGHNPSQSEPVVCRTLVRFNRSARLREQLQEADEPAETPAEEKPQFNGRRVLMPEYVVGQKKMKRPTQRKAATAKGKKDELQLDHLMEENEDDDEDEEQNEME